MPRLLADLLLATALVARVTETTAVLFKNGTVEFKRGDRTVATHLLVSGQGTRNRSAIEAQLSVRHGSSRDLVVPLAGAIVTGTTGNAATRITPPPDVVLGDTTESIVHGQATLPLFNADALRQDPAHCRLVAP